MQSQYPILEKLLYSVVIVCWSTGLSLLVLVLQALEAEIQAHEPLIQGVNSTAQELITGGHYASESILKRNNVLQESWKSLRHKTQERSLQLNDSLEAHQVCVWGGVCVCGGGVFVGGVCVHGCVYVVYLYVCECVGACGMYNINTCVHIDIHSYEKTSSNTRVCFPQYYTQSNEAESWMKDKKPLVSSRDYGKDEDSAEVLLKKHEAVELDIEGFSTTISNLADRAHAMTDRRHFDRCALIGLHLCRLVNQCKSVHTYTGVVSLYVYTAWLARGGKGKCVHIAEANIHLP